MAAPDSVPRSVPSFVNGAARRRGLGSWLGLGAVALGLGCSGGEAPSRPGVRAQGRPSDPPLTVSWRLPADESALENADLGSEPPALAQALMAGSAAPSLTHRIVTACADRGALDGTATVAVRLTIAASGAVASIEGDPPGRAASCVVEGLHEPLAELAPLPAGAALLVLRFHPDAPR